MTKIDIRNEKQEINTIIFAECDIDYYTACQLVNDNDTVMIQDKDSPEYELLIKDRDHAERLIFAINEAINFGWFKGHEPSKYVCLDDGDGTFSIELTEDVVYVSDIKVCDFVIDRCKPFAVGIHAPRVVCDSVTISAYPCYDEALEVYRIQSLDDARNFIKALERTIELGWLK